MTTEETKSAQVDFTHDSIGRLSSVSRINNDNPATTPSASSGTTLLTMNLLDRVTSITHLKVGASTTTLSQFSYAYDANGRVVSSAGPEGSLSFALDANGQLLSVTGTRAESYAYDANGNRSTNTTGVGNLLLNDGQFNYTYDFEGNRKTRTRLSDGQVTEYYWDHRNQLTLALVKNANGGILKELRFSYDVEGRRVGEWVDADGAGPLAADQAWTVFDGVNPYLDLNAAGQLKTKYLHGPGIDELFARIGNGEDPEWYLTDRLGSVRQIVNGSGTILDEITYDSYGNILCETNPNQGDRFKFTGREFSSELGIYYYRARWYDPTTGQFISQDPIGFSAGDTNLSRYVGNSPVDATDPEGLDIYYILAPTGAGGFGHAAIVIGPLPTGGDKFYDLKIRIKDDKTGKIVEKIKSIPITKPFLFISINKDSTLYWDFAVSRILPGGGGVPFKLDIAKFLDFDDFFKSAEGKRYSYFIKISTTPKEDDQALNCIFSQWNSDAGYRLRMKNCANLPLGALEKIGVIKSPPFFPGPNWRATALIKLLEKGQEKNSERKFNIYYRDSHNKLVSFNPDEKWKKLLLVHFYDLGDSILFFIRNFARQR